MEENVIDYKKMKRPDFKKMLEGKTLSQLNVIIKDLGIAFNEESERYTEKGIDASSLRARRISGYMEMAFLNWRKMSRAD